MDLIEHRFPPSLHKWTPVAASIPELYRFCIMRDKPDAQHGAKEFSGFTTLASAVDYVNWCAATHALAAYGPRKLLGS
jgi:N-acyl-L-homoserine lactone synthetase